MFVRATGIPVWIGRKLHTRYRLSGKHKRNFAVLGGVAASVSIGIFHFYFFQIKIHSKAPATSLVHIWIIFGRIFQCRSIRRNPLALEFELMRKRE